MKHSKLRFLALALCAGVLLAAPAWADTAPVAPLAQSLTGQAKADYESARLLFDDGDHPGALAKFSHAYDVSHDARLLWNMAVCEKELRHYARTATLIGRYLKEGGSRLTAEQRQNAVDTQTALRSFYAKVQLTGVPDGATVSVDGAPAGKAPLSEPLLLDLGTRTLRVEQPGFEPSETRVEVPGGQDIALTIAPLSPVRVLPARLNVSTSGARDIVSVDGKVVGTQRWEGTLPNGEHTVRVTADHKKPYESHVQLTSGSARSLQITLEDETHASNVWLWVSGGAVVVAAAAVGGYFLFKPEESPGAHPEGKLTTVYLPLGSGAR